MSRNQLIGKYAKESNCTPPPTVQAGDIAGAVYRWETGEGVFITKKCHRFSFFAAVSVGAEHALQKGHYDTECA